MTFEPTIRTSFVTSVFHRNITVIFVVSMTVTERTFFLALPTIVSTVCVLFPFLYKSFLILNCFCVHLAIFFLLNDCWLILLYYLDRFFRFANEFLVDRRRKVCFEVADQFADILKDSTMKSQSIIVNLNEFLLYIILLIDVHKHNILRSRLRNPKVIRNHISIRCFILYQHRAYVIKSPIHEFLVCGHHLHLIVAVFDVLLNEIIETQVFVLTHCVNYPISCSFLLDIYIDITGFEDLPSY